MAEATKTALVGNEKGECSQFEDQIMDVARLKLGFGTVTAAGSTTVQTATLNAASGVITTAAISPGASGASPATVTLTNSKIVAGDTVFAMLDATNKTSSSMPIIANVSVSAGQAIFNLVSISSTGGSSDTYKIYFWVGTAGNTGN